MLQTDIHLRFGRKKYDDVLQGLEAFARQLESSYDGSIKVVSREMRSYLELVVEEVVRRNSRPYPGGTSNNSLSSRSGKSMESLRSSIRVTGRTIGTLRGQFGGGYPLMYHEFGSTTRAKGKLLTIPLPAALDSRGIPLKPNSRAWKNTFVGKSKKGNLLIFQRRGKDIVPLYVLKESATIKPRLGLRQEMQDQLPYFASQATDALVRFVEAEMKK